MPGRSGGVGLRGVRELTLRDGSSVEVRPMRREDKELLQEGFRRLSPDSRYRRFLSPMPELSDRLAEYLVDVDHHDHEALLATSPRGDAIGVARYVRSTGDERAAEVAVTVADDWQGRGLGTQLLELLADRAREEGISRFTALLLADNREMLDVLEELGDVRVTGRHSGTIEVETELPETGIGAHLLELLRHTAAGRWLAVSPLRNLAQRL